MAGISFKCENLSAKLVPNGVLKGSMSVSEYCYDYNGSYTATPTNEEQIFETKEKRMADNFTVQPIPFDLSSDTVEPEKLLYNVTAHDKTGNAIVGTMPYNGVVDGVISKKDDVYFIQEGYYEGGTAQISQDEQDKIISDNIREGVTILGVTGSITGSDDSASILDRLITRSIIEISNNRVETIGSEVFYACSGLTTVNFPLVETIGTNAFYNCSGLTTVNFPSLVSIGNYAFRACKSLSTAAFPLATSIGSGVFQDCSGLTTVDFPLALNIGVYLFNKCSKLTTLILRKSDAICTLSNVNAFTSTPIASGTGYIYVPSALVESYKAAARWSTYADQIRAIEDYPEITGG